MEEQFTMIFKDPEDRFASVKSYPINHSVLGMNQMNQIIHELRFFSFVGVIISSWDKYLFY